jgi:hypothetical protein
MISLIGPISPNQSDPRIEPVLGLDCDPVSLDWTINISTYNIIL